MKLRFPDHALLQTETEAHVFPSFAQQGEDGDMGFALSWGEAAQLQVQVWSAEKPLTYLRLRWQFTPAEKRAGQLRILGDAWERAGGDLEWRGIVPERCMPWFFLVSEGSDALPASEDRLTEGFGVKVQPGAMCFWQYDTDGVTLWADLRCGGRGVLLGGRRLAVCTVLFAEFTGMSAFQAGKAFCRAMSPDPRPVPYPVYGANNWYYAYGKSSQSDILSDAKLLSQMTAGLSNRPFMVIDDGWTANPKNGPWDAGGPDFPDMPGLAERIHASGARPGIWVRHIYDCGHVCGLPEDWHLAGDNNCLDPSLPGVLDYIYTVTKRFCDWGYKLIKFDCSTQDILGRRGYRVPYVIAEDGWCLADRSRTTAEILTDYYRTVRAAAGDDALLMGCATISHLSAGIVEIGRTGADINGNNWDITRRMGVNTLAFRMMMHKALFQVDADCVGITGTLPEDKVLTWLKILSESGTTLFVSCDPKQASPTVLKALEAAYAAGSRQTDELIPLDWMENICPDRWLLNGRAVDYSWYHNDWNPMFTGFVPKK